MIQIKRNYLWDQLYYQLKEQTGVDITIFKYSEHIWGLIGNNLNNRLKNQFDSTLWSRLQVNKGLLTGGEV